MVIKVVFKMRKLNDTRLSNLAQTSIASFRAFQMQVVYICVTIYEISTGTPASRSPSATVGLVFSSNCQMSQLIVFVDIGRVHLSCNRCQCIAVVIVPTCDLDLQSPASHGHD